MTTVEAKTITLENRAIVESSRYRFCGAIDVPDEASADSPSPAYHICIEGAWDDVTTYINVTRSKDSGYWHDLLLEAREWGNIVQGGVTSSICEAVERVNKLFAGKYNVIIKHGEHDNPMKKATFWAELAARHLHAMHSIGSGDAIPSSTRGHSG